MCAHTWLQLISTRIIISVNTLICANNCACNAAVKCYNYFIIIAISKNVQRSSVKIQKKMLNITQHVVVSTDRADDIKGTSELCPRTLLAVHGGMPFRRSFYVFVRFSHAMPRPWYVRCFNVYGQVQGAIWRRQSWMGSEPWVVYLRTDLDENVRVVLFYYINNTTVSKV